MKLWFDGRQRLCQECPVAGATGTDGSVAKVNFCLFDSIVFMGAVCWVGLWSCLTNHWVFLQMGGFGRSGVVPFKRVTMDGVSCRLFTKKIDQSEPCI